jgi:hypothetical protein
MRPLVLSLLLVCFGATLKAQTQAPKSEPSPSVPSMQDTAQWITSKLMLTGDDSTAGPNHSTYEPIRAHVESCVLTYTVHRSMENTIRQKGVSWDETHIFHLGAIASVSPNAESRLINVAISLSSQADKVAYDNIEGSWPLLPQFQPPTSNHILLPFGVGNGQDNDDLSKRMQKALTHAQELCAASYNERNGKEPF